MTNDCRSGTRKTFGQKTKSRRQVEAHFQGLGEWFQNNGETLGQTIRNELLARGRGDLLGGLDDSG